MERKETSGLVSIKIMRGNELPESTRAKLGISGESFVEVRITRNSPPAYKIIPIEGTPARGWRKAIESSGMVGEKLP